MAEQSLPAKFEHDILEADIKRLAAEVQRHRENPELRGLSDQEILRKSIQSFGSAETAPTNGAPPVPNAQTQSSSNSLPDYAKDAPAEAKLEIEYLLDMVLHHGIEKADAEARKSSPFIMDAFRDALATKLYPELQKRGIVK